VSARPGLARGQAALRHLELTITRRLDGLLQGDHQGLVPGSGSDPGEGRVYQPGDDVRRMDWNLTARTTVAHVRETIADRELETWALVDLSPSLDFGTARCEKRDLAVAAVAAVGFLTHHTGNRVGALLVRPDGTEVVPARIGRDHLLALLHRIVSTPRGTGTTDLTAAIARLGASARRRGLAVIVSDFLAEPAWTGALQAVATRHEVLCIEVIDPRELDLPDVGLLELVDPRTGRQRQVHTTAEVRNRYRAAAAEQRARSAAAMRAAGADHLVLRTDRDWVEDLLRFVVARRLRLAGAR